MKILKLPAPGETESRCFHNLASAGGPASSDTAVSFGNSSLIAVDCTQVFNSVPVKAYTPPSESTALGHIISDTA